MDVNLSINSCRQCPNWEMGPDESTDGWDRGNDWTCKLTGKKIRGFVEWHEENKVKIPDWCPFRSTGIIPRAESISPCDCKSAADVSRLSESGLKINDYGIEVSPNKVIVSMPNGEFWIPMHHFKKFATWYLESQVIEKK